MFWYQDFFKECEEAATFNSSGTSLDYGPEKKVHREKESVDWQITSQECFKCTNKGATALQFMFSAVDVTVWGVKFAVPRLAECIEASTLRVLFAQQT